MIVPAGARDIARAGSPSLRGGHRAQEVEGMGFFVDALRSGWRSLLAITGLCLIVAVGVALTQEQTYSSTSDVLWLQEQDFSGGGDQPTRVVRTLAALAQTEAVLGSAATELGTDVSILRAGVTAAPGLDNDIISITASASKAGDAAAYANAVASSLVAFRTRQEQQQIQGRLDVLATQEATLRAAGPDAVSALGTVIAERASATAGLAAARGDTVVAQPAEVPSSPASPRPLLNAAVGVLVGLLVGLLVVISRARLSSRPTRPEQIADGWGAPLLGVIHGVERDERAAYGGVRNALVLGGADRMLVLVAPLSPKHHDGEACRWLSRTLVASGRRTAIVRVGAADVDEADGALVIRDSDLPVKATVALRKSIDAHGTRNGGGSALEVVLVPDEPSHDGTFHSPGAAVLVEVLRGRYDVVLLDVPPLLPSGDAALIAEATGGGILLVVRSGRATHDELEAGRDMVERSHAQRLGVLVTAR